VSWPLIGRREEMRLIEAAILASDVSGVVVRGPAGVTQWAVGTSSARTLPLGAFTAWAQSGVTDPVQLVRGVIESLTAAPQGATVVVGVDDAPLLDDLSIFVVH
jgi:hypothetical protein